AGDAPLLERLVEAQAQRGEEILLRAHVDIDEHTHLDRRERKSVGQGFLHGTPDAGAGIRGHRASSRARPRSDPERNKENRMKATLTNRSVAQLVPPTAGRLEVLDAKMPGLALRITPSGHKSWTVVWHQGRQARRHAIGVYPALTLATAR